MNSLNMDELEGNSTRAELNMPSHDLLTPKPKLVNSPLLLEEESAAKFVCRLCKKSFYNMKALQNHRTTQHDVEDSSSDDEQHVVNIKYEQNANNEYDFTFIPYTNPEQDHTTQEGFTTRVYSEDTSYLIVKVESDGTDLLEKRARMEGITAKIQTPPIKEPIDLRGPFTCTFPSSMRPEMQCRQVFFNCCEYSLHYRQEHTKRRKAALRCQVCEKRLDRDFYPNNTPTELFHPESHFTFSCRICGQTFMDSAQYDEHNRIVHAKVKPHQCSICSKRFTQQGGLQQHLRMHTGIRPFACTVCQKAFTQKAGLDQHLRTHTKVKPFKCVVCTKGFSQSVHLRQHMRTHTNIQPFECSVCGRRFKQSSHLNFHMRSHIGEAGAMVMEHYARAGHPRNPGEFLNLANLQPVQDGETLYYAAELAAGPAAHHHPFTYLHHQPQVISNNVFAM